MKFAAYPRTKPSGVEWLGDVPEHWTLPPLANRYAVELGKMLNEDRITGDHLIPYLRNVDVQWDRVNTADLPEMDIPQRERERFTVRAGDLLVCEGGEVGRAAIVGNNASGLGFQKALHRLRARNSSELSRFIFYTLAAASNSGVFVAGGNPNTIPHLTSEKLRRYRFPVPPLPEQQAIAACLDRETERLDRLVAQKRELIERLKEKRTALISRTVTRGLPPAAARSAGLPESPPLKPSGVEWIGDIPKHWDLVAYKRVCTRVDVGIAEAATHAYCDDGVPIIRSTNVKSNKLHTSDVLRIEPWFAEKNRTKTLRAGDLVTVRTGYPGTTAIVPPEFDGCQCFTLVLSTPKRTAHGPFFSWVLNSNPGASYFEMEGWGTAQTNISVPIVRFMPVPRPPLPEQVAIAAYLDAETAKLDALVEKVEAAVERLQEYRTALITAAVTGKIDVREKVVA